MRNITSLIMPLLLTVFLLLAGTGLLCLIFGINNIEELQSLTLQLNDHLKFSILIATFVVFILAFLAIIRTFYLSYDLQRNLTLLASTFEAANDGLLAVDQNNKILTFNRKFLGMWHIPQEFIDSGDNEKVTEHILTLLKNPESYSLAKNAFNESSVLAEHNYLELKNGTIFEQYTHPQKIGGKMVGYILSFRNITETKRSEIERQVIFEISEGVNTTENLDALLGLIHHAIGKVLYAENCFVALYDKKNELLKMKFFVDKFDSAPPPFKLEKRQTAYVFRRGRPILMNPEIVRQLTDSGEIESQGTLSAAWLGVPLNTTSETIGVLVVQNYEDEFAYSNRDLEFLSSVGNQIALAIERKRSEEELQKNLSLLTSTFEATADGILVVDRSNQIIAYNKQFLKMWQIPEKIIESRSNDQLVAFVLDQLASPGQFLAATKKLIKNPENKNFDTVKFKNGNIYERYSHPQVLDGKVVGRVISFRDITERKKVEEALQENRARYQQLFDSNPYPIWVYDTETLQILAVNQESLRHYGYTQEEFLELTIEDIRPVEDVEQFKDLISTMPAEGDAVHYSRHRKKNGNILEVEVASQSITFDERPARLALITDITERKRAEAALRESEYKLRTLLESMNEGLSQADNEQLIEFVNDRFCDMTGYAREELLGKSTFEFLVDDEGRQIVNNANEARLKGEASQYELRIKKKSGDSLWVIVGAAPVINAAGEVTGSMGVFTDITERKLAEEQLLHDALHDGLTGLANRTLFINHLQLTITRGRRSSQNLYAVLFLDFDRFKVINDSLGHAEGDNLLKQIARRLENSLRGGDLLARLGGDEFTILLNELNETNDAIQVAERILKDLNIPFILGNQEIYMSASIGIALCSSGHMSADDMLRDADIAMYRAKAKGKAQYQVFDQTMHKHALNKLQLETEMHHALQRGEFCMNYQPIVHLESSRLMGFEALIRWEHPERGMVSPADFIPMAEENGLVIPLGRWILFESCRQLREWQISNPLASNLSVSVNLSSKQFLHSDLVEQVHASLISTRLDPRCLKLEITESHLMENSDKAVTMMNRLRAIGIEISLDDFGTGYSSLSYLHRLPVNYLKIDRSFVYRMVESKENGEIVYTIVKLAQNLKMKVIAEGIETIEQVAKLKLLGCEYGQGYFISEPLSVDAATQFINDHLENSPLLITQPLLNAEMNL